MSDKIYHIAVKVPDIDEAKGFYKDIFGFEELKQDKVRDHTSCHLTDGGLDLAIIEYESEASPEAGLAGPGACIHHIGVEVDDLESYQQKLLNKGCKIVSAPGVLGKTLGPRAGSRNNPDQTTIVSSRLVSLSLRGFGN